jgi:hypothetical protein
MRRRSPGLMLDHPRTAGHSSSRLTPLTRLGNYLGAGAGVSNGMSQFLSGSLEFLAGIRDGRAADDTGYSDPCHVAASANLANAGKDLEPVFFMMEAR